MLSVRIYAAFMPPSGVPSRFLTCLCSGFIRV